MGTYDLVYWLIIGLVAGFIAEKVMGGNQGLLANLAVGIIGAFIGGFLANQLGIAFAGIVGTIVVATIGAIIFLAALRFIRSG